MKNIVALALVSSFALSMCATTSAEARPYWKKRVNQRQTHQQTRIYNGASNGALTAREARRLEKRQGALAMREARYRHSGAGLTPAEAARLENQQDHLSKSIYKQKHDAQTHQ